MAMKPAEQGRKSHTPLRKTSTPSTLAPSAEDEFIEDIRISLREMQDGQVVDTVQRIRELRTRSGNDTAAG